MISIRPKNWESFQHYKNRCPPWVKLHKTLLDDYEFTCLPLASKALAPLLWLLASENKDGTITGTVTKIAFRLRWTESDVEEGLRGLIASGLFMLDSGALAERLHVAPKSLSETEGETQVEKIPSDPKKDPQDASRENRSSVAQPPASQALEDALWAEAVPFLTAAGKIDERSARSFVGKCLKLCGADHGAALEVFRRARLEHAEGRVNGSLSAWIIAEFQPQEARGPPERGPSQADIQALLARTAKHVAAS